MKKTVPTVVKDKRLIEKRRKQMVKAAAKLFSKKGFHRTTTREIAKESGFSIGTLYEYIRSKEDVLYLVCDAIYEQVRNRLEEEMAHGPTGLAALEQAIIGFFKVVDDLQDEVLVMYQEANALGEALPYVLNKELEMAAMFEEILRDCVASGELNLPNGDIRMAAHNILVCGQMWTFRRWVLRKMYTAEAYARLQVEYLLRGMTGKDQDEREAGLAPTTP